MRDFLLYLKGRSIGLLRMSLYLFANLIEDGDAAVAKGIRRAADWLERPQWSHLPNIPASLDTQELVDDLNKWLYEGETVSLHISDDTQGYYWIGNGENDTFFCVKASELNELTDRFTDDWYK